MFSLCEFRDKSELKPKKTKILRYQDKLKYLGLQFNIQNVTTPKDSLRLTFSVTRLGEFSPFGLHFEGPGEFLSCEIRPRNRRIFGLLFKEENFLIFKLNMKF